jgi:subfamily B ATP-binding cassette protein MsbA
MRELRRLLPLLKPHGPALVLAVVCSGVVAALTAVRTYLIKVVFDRGFAAGDLAMLGMMTLAIPGLYLAAGALTYLKNLIHVRIGNSIATELRERVYRHLQRIPVDYFVSRSSTGATIAKLTNDLANIYQMVYRVPSALVVDLVTVIGLVVVLFVLSAKFAMLTLVVLLFALAPVVVFSRKLRHYSRANQMEVANLYRNLQESISAISLTRTFVQEDREISRFSRINGAVYTAVRKFARTELMSSPMMEFIGAVGVALALYLGGVDVVAGRWTQGSFLAFIAAALSFYQPVKRLTDINPLLQQGVVAIERVFGILDQQSRVVEQPVPRAATCTESIVFRGVSFSYDGRRRILDRVDLRIGAGERVAVVGPSGAGKSTLVNLLLRFNDPSDGSILLDGVDIRACSLASLRRLFGVVTQDTFLFNETLRYNIAYGAPGASEERILAAARAAHLGALLERLPDGLDTLVGERGHALSGGERQRIAIARALLIEPPVLVFDEPTSALDAESESVVMKAIEESSASRTVLLITHRLNLAGTADRVYVVDAGRIVQAGTPRELASTDGMFRTLLALQQPGSAV